MNILILYFSGTGNTAFIANQIFNQLDKQLYDVKKVSINKMHQRELEKSDIIIFGFPVYACDMPEFMKHYIQELKTVSHKGLIVYATMGIYAANSIKKVTTLFLNKGFKPLHYEEIKMPGSDGLIFMKENSKYVKNVLATNFNNKLSLEKAVFNIIKKINEVDRIGLDKVSQKIPKLKISGLILGGFLKILYGLLEKYLKKKFRVNDNCINCGFCEEICPSENILIKNNKRVFLDRCYLCMRCVNQCPVEAIQIGKKTEGKFRYKGPMGNFNP